jgi:exodeoxyribonuclease VIII
VTDVIDLTKALAESLAKPEVIPCPPPGVYHGVPDHVYHAWDAASNSALTLLHRSPAHLKARREEPPEEKATLALGRAMHSAILEPDEFKNRYVPGPRGDRRTKAIKEQWESLEATFGEGHVLTSDKYNVCLRARDSIYAHPGARKVFAGPGSIELSIVWTDADTGLRCKARIDRHSPALPGGVIVDVKSTTDARKGPFERSIDTYGYHRQAAFYLEGARACGLEAKHFVNVPVEKEPPFAVGAYRMIDEAVDAGRRQLRALLTVYASCVASDEWPAYSPLIEDVGLPAYAWSRIDDELAEFEAQEAAS